MKTKKDVRNSLHFKLILSYITTGVMLVMTLWSGIDYLKSYWKFIDPTK